MRWRSSARPRVRALVLTAGYGTRLRPLTETIAKPLLPVNGRAVAAHSLDALVAVGCERAVLNLHHLGDRVRAHFGDTWRGMPIDYSEEPEILGTLGALVPHRSVLGDADVVLMINGDALCTWPLERLIRRHLASAAAATLLLHGRVPAATYGGGVGIDGEGRVTKLRDAPASGPVVHRQVFTGAHALDPGLLATLPSSPGDIVSDLYIPLLAAGNKVASLTTKRRWHDLGTPARYHRAVIDWSRGLWPAAWWRGRRVAPSAQVAGSARLRATIVEHGVRVGEHARLERAVLLDDAVVGAGCRVERSVLGPGVMLPDSTSLQGRLVVRHVPGTSLPEGSSQLGELVLTPL